MPASESGYDVIMKRKNQNKDNVFSNLFAGLAASVGVFGTWAIIAIVFLGDLYFFYHSIATCHCPKLAEDGKDELLFGVGLEMLLRILQKDESGGFSRRDLENICGSGSVTSFNNPGDVDYLPVDLADQLGDNGEPL